MSYSPIFKSGVYRNKRFRSGDPLSRNARKIIAVGVSAGGFATVALTADHPPAGLVAAISFAGGRGSRSSDNVCDPGQLVKTFGEFGKTSRVPMLWVYAENDHFFNPALAKRFHDAFKQQGGNAELVIAPAYQSEGHYLFSTAGIPEWTPLLDQFLKSQNLVLRSEPLPLTTVHLKMPPHLSGGGKKDFDAYLKSAPHKAFAVANDGAYGWRTGRHTIEDAKESAVSACSKYTRDTCAVYALDDELVQN
jgi:hypothetical protein